MFGYTIIFPAVNLKEKVSRPARNLQNMFLSHTVLIDNGAVFC